jgi:hypothetical protein
MVIPNLCGFRLSDCAAVTCYSRHQCLKGLCDLRFEQNNKCNQYKQDQHNLNHSDAIFFLYKETQFVHGCSSFPKNAGCDTFPSEYPAANITGGSVMQHAE